MRAGPLRLGRGRAGFLVALQFIDTAGGPPLGEHNLGRGGPISLSAEEVHEAIKTLGGEIYGHHATQVWEEAAEAEWNDPMVWSTATSPLQPAGRRQSARRSDRLRWLRCG